MAAQNFGKKRLLTNAAANFTGFAAQVVVAFFLSPILINGLGERRYGVWSLVESVLAYLTVLDLGLTVSVVRYVARFEANSERDNQNRIFSTSLCLFGLSGLVVLAISSGLRCFGPTRWAFRPMPSTTCAGFFSFWDSTSPLAFRWVSSAPCLPDSSAIRSSRPFAPRR